MSTARNDARFVVDVPREVWDDEPETGATAPPIRVQRHVPEPPDDQFLRAIELSGTLDFWNRPDEDLYTAADGEPV